MRRTRKRRHTINDFWVNIDKNANGGCWHWMGRVQRGGYGEFCLNGKNQLTHRLSYTLTYGEIPDGKIICHKCDVRICCNPDHLFVGTASDNKIDCLVKGHHSQAKLNPDKVREIRVKRLKGTSTRVLAKEFNISRRTIKDILKGTRWAHVQ